jgi:hypothetical protein
LLDDVGRNSRALHIFFWANVDKTLKPLHSPAGLARMTQRGLLTPAEQQLIVSAGIESGRHNLALQWIMMRVLTAGGGAGAQDGNRERIVGGGAGFEASFLDTCKVAPPGRCNAS